MTKIALLTAVAVATAPLTSPLWACPSYVSAQEVPLTGKRQDFRLYAIKTDGGVRRWESLPIQVDPLDEKGVLRTATEGDAAKDPQRLAGSPGDFISPLDRITLRQEDFGVRMTSDAAPCRAARAIELSDPASADRFAYLAVCNDAAPDTRRPVAHDASIQKVTGPRFEYDYQKNNQLMYRSLYAKGPGWSNKILAGADADLNLHLDIRKFFTVDFTNKDVESYVGNTSVGPVGMVGSMDFFLRLLFFKINLKMGTTVGFYADSAHIPAMIDVPRDAPKMLHPGSGLLYVWAKKEARIEAPSVTEAKPTMPIADPKVILSGWERNAKRGLPYCDDALCTYRLQGGVGDERFGLDVNVPRSVAERGFYPQWVGSVGKFKRDMGWDGDAEDDPETVAVFFDNSGLTQGQYRVDQWIRIGQREALSTRCPKPLTIGTAVSFGAADVSH